MSKLNYKLSLFIICTLLSACSENVKQPTISTVQNNSQFDYLDNTKGKPASQVAKLLIPSKNILSGLRVLKIDRKKVPSTGLVYQTRDIVVAPGIKIIHLQHKIKQVRFMVILEEGKSYILKLTNNEGKNKYQVTEKSTGKQVTLSYL